MIHAPVNMGAGWHCPRCNVAWDQGEPEPADCVPSIQGAGIQPIGPEEEGVMRIFDGERRTSFIGSTSHTDYLIDDPNCQRRFWPITLVDQPDTEAISQAVQSGADASNDVLRSFISPSVSDPMQRQVQGNHYRNLVIQPTEFCMRNGLDFCIGSILKYVSRYRAKNGIEDLRKARHFVEIRERFAYDIQPPRYIAITMLEYVSRNNIRPDDAEALYRLEAYYNGSGDHTIGAARLIREIDTLIDLFA